MDAAAASADTILTLLSECNLITRTHYKIKEIGCLEGLKNGKVLKQPNNQFKSIYFSPQRASMDRISMICHMYGWGVPAILTLVALLTHSIEADELTSVCLPGKFYII